jgi:peptide/nickel transport system substrate-binding protein
MVCAADMRLLPLEIVDRSPQSLLGLVYESLVYLDDERNPQPLLAEKWEAVGGSIWEFTLRSGIMFHDGSELTAQDVVATLNAISALAQQGIGLYQQTVSMLADWEAKSTYVVRVKARTPSFATLYSMTFPVLPEGSTTVECPPGTGPYSIDYYQPGSQLLLSVSGTWWQRAPSVRLITGRWYKTDADALAAFQIEAVNVLATRSQQATRYRGIIGSTVTSMQYSTRQLELLLFNNSASKLKDVEMRRAISHAIDRGRLASSVYQNVVTATDTLAMPGSSLYNSNAPAYYYNPDYANRLLDALGYSKRNGEGFRTNEDGTVTLSLRLFYYDEEGSTLRHDAAFLIDNMLAQVGIDVVITYYQFENGKAKLEIGDYDMFLCGINFGMVPDPTFLLARNSETNYTRYRGESVNSGEDDEQLSQSSQPSIKDLLQQLSNASTQEAFQAVWMDIQDRMGTDQPMLPLYWRGGMLLMRGVYLSARDIREYETLRTFAESNR